MLVGLSIAETISWGIASPDRVEPPVEPRGA